MNNAHFTGVSTDRLPVEIYPNGDYPVTVVSTRDTFERVLRSLVYRHNRIRHVAGTVTGLGINDGNHKTIDYVSIRLEGDSSETKIQASLVVGTCNHHISVTRLLNSC